MLDQPLLDLLAVSDSLMCWESVLVRCDGHTTVELAFV